MAGVGWLGLSKGITQIGTWIATIIIARLLTPGDYGLVGMSGLLVGIITLVGDFGLNSSIIQKKEVSHQELSALFWIYILIGFLLSGLIYLLAPLGVKFWGEPQLLNLIRISSLIFLIDSIAQVPVSLLQKKMKFREYGIVLSLAAISGSVVSIIFAYYGWGPYSLIFGTLAIVMIKASLSYFLEPFRPLFVFFTKDTIMHLKFGTTLTAGRYLWWYYSNCDYWLASKFLGKSAYGSYSMAFQLASLPIDKIAGIIHPVAFSSFSKINDDHERREFFLKILKYMAYLSFPIFIGFYWIAEDMINILLGEKWQNSILAFKIFVLVFPLRCLDSLNSPLLNSIRRVDIGMKNMAIGAVLATLAFGIGVQYGIDGLAYSWLVFYPVFFTICLINVARATNISIIIYILNFKKIILNITIMSISIFIFQHIYNTYIERIYLFELYRLLGTIITGLISFLVFLIYIDRNIFNEIKTNIFKKNIK